MKQLRIDDFLCGAFGGAHSPPEVRARVDAYRRAAEAAQTRARRDDPGTSVDAAVRWLKFSSKHELLIAVALADLGAHGGTIHELAAKTGLDGVAIARRMKALQTAGRAVRSGETRPTPSGRQAAVWLAGGA